MENILISNEKDLEKKKKIIRSSGAASLHILADFDRTLTKAFIDGQSTPSLISILRDGSYLTADYVEKAQDLYRKYHPIEVDPEISPVDKKKAMEEWWLTHFDLLIKSGLNKKDLERVVESGKIMLRAGAPEFFDFLYNNKIPLVIMSSSGLGGDVIRMYLAKEGLMSDNVHIISNTYGWDADGFAAAVKKPIIHAMNKDETLVKDFPAVFGSIKDRRNVILLGDSSGDVGMIEGFDYNALIKIGFLNENVEESIKQYRAIYDVLILNDSSMGYVNILLSEMIKQ